MLFFDIETAGRYSSYEEFKLADPSGAKIYLGKCDRLKIEDPIICYRDKVSLFPEFGKIVCISYGLLKDGKITVSTINDDNEIDLLKKTAALFHKATDMGLIPTGWNIKNYDVSWIYRKLLMNGLSVPECLNTWGKKPWEISIIDLKEWWKGYSNLDVTFEEAAYGLGLPSPKDAMDGSQVHENYWFKNNAAGITTYCEKDVRTMILMCEKIHSIYNPIKTL